MASRSGPAGNSVSSVLIGNTAKHGRKTMSRLTRPNETPTSISTRQPQPTGSSPTIMHERLRCAVIGTGGFGFAHLDSLLHCPRATAVAIAEINPERLKEAADRYKIARAYADYHDLLDQPDIDAVTIDTTNHLQAQVAHVAYKAGE